MKDIRRRLVDREVNPVRKTIGDALVTIGTGKPPKDDIQERLMTQYYLKELSKDPELEALKKQNLYNQVNKAEMEPEGYVSEADIPKSVGGLNLKGARVGKGGRFLPEYGPSLPDEIPTGFVNVGGKLVKDPTYQDPDKPESQIIQARKIKATDDIFSTVANTNQKAGKIERGLKAAQNLPQGFLGGMQLAWMKAFDTKNPSLGDWQEMKSLLTDAQLQNVAKTKGAISDREMSLFSQAAANDDFPSVVRQERVLNAMKQAIFDEQEGKINAYSRNFNEDPRNWEELGYRPFPSQQQMGQVYSSMQPGPFLPSNSNSNEENPQVGGTFNGKKIKRVTRVS